MVTTWEGGKPCLVPLRQYQGSSDRRNQGLVLDAQKRLMEPRLDRAVG